MKTLLSLLLLATPLTAQDPQAVEVQRLQTHYRAVIAALSGRDVSGLDLPTLTERRRAIAHRADSRV